MQKQIGTVVAVFCGVVPLFLSGSTAVAADVLTQHNSEMRTGWNDQERTLNPTSVNSPNFGLLFSRFVDDKIYGQPLYMQGVNINGQTRNVVFVATASDSVYAFDADDPNAAAPLWHASLLGAGETPGAASDVGASHRTDGAIPSCGSALQPYQDMYGNIGVTGTPVIDPKTRTLYVVSKSKGTKRLLVFSVVQYIQRLHALDLSTGREQPNFPLETHASVAGSNEFGATSIVFNAMTQNQRAALALWTSPASSHAIVLVAWGSHGDAAPYHGWLIAFDGITGETVGVLNTTPRIREMDECGSLAGGGSIWQAGQGPSIDSSGNIWVMTGNGEFDPALGDYGSSILKISLDLSHKQLFVADFFTPANWQHLNWWDVDIGSAGLLVSPWNGPFVGGGKEGRLYTLDPTNLGGLQKTEGSNGFWAIGQHIGARHIHGSPVTWESSRGWLTYVWPENDWLRAFQITHAGAYGRAPELAHSDLDTGCGALALECMPGGMLSISSFGTADDSGIIWASLPAEKNAVHQIVPGRLVAFRALPQGGKLQELWSSDQSPSYAAAPHRAKITSDYKFAKFGAPTVANGKVYLATFSNELRVYGLRSGGL